MREISEMIHWHSDIYAVRKLQHILIWTPDLQKIIFFRSDRNTRTGTDEYQTQINACTKFYTTKTTKYGKSMREKNRNKRHLFDTGS